MDKTLERGQDESQLIILCGTDGVLHRLERDFEKLQRDIRTLITPSQHLIVALWYLVSACQPFP